MILWMQPVEWPNDDSIMLGEKERRKRNFINVKIKAKQEVVKYFFCSDDIHSFMSHTHTQNEDDCWMINYFFLSLFIEIIIYSSTSAFCRLKASSSHIFLSSFPSSSSHWPSFLELFVVIFSLALLLLWIIPIRFLRSIRAWRKYR